MRGAAGQEKHIPAVMREYSPWEVMGGEHDGAETGIASGGGRPEGVIQHMTHAESDASRLHGDQRQRRERCDRVPEREECRVPPSDA